jgi:hypothetical protein
MEELIQRVAAAASIPPEKAQTAIGMILAFLKKDGPAADVDALLAGLPGAAEAAAAKGPNGLLAGFAGAIGGGLMGLAGQLTSLGLGFGEMQAIGKEVFAFAREKVGDERLGQIVAAVPGLSQFV